MIDFNQVENMSWVLNTGIIIAILSVCVIFIAWLHDHEAIFGGILVFVINLVFVFGMLGALVITDYEYTLVEPDQYKYFEFEERHHLIYKGIEFLIKDYSVIQALQNNQRVYHVQGLNSYGGSQGISFGSFEVVKAELEDALQH